MRNVIVQIVTQQEAGGAQRVALLLHHELLARGLRSEVWFLYRRTSAFNDEPHVYALWPRRPRLHETPAMFGRLLGWLLRSRPRAVITHTHYANAAGLAAAWACRVRSRIAVHHNAIRTYPWLARMLEACSRRLGLPTRTVAVSRDVEASLLAWNAAAYNGTTSCIYNGLGDAGPAPAADGVDLAADLKGSRILFSVGRLAAQKNHQALVSALPYLPGCAAVIAGCGPLEAALRRQAEELGIGQRVLLLGEVSSERVAAWMRRADAFVFPSLFEAMPMALLEAMRAGMAIVASDIAAHREVADGCAVLADTSAENLASAIERALAQKEAGNALGRRAQARSREFTAHAMADAYLGVL